MPLLTEQLLDNIESENSDTLIHEDAIYKIMRVVGPALFAGNKDIKRLLQGLRAFAVNDAIINRRHTIFAEADWIELTADESIWSPRQSLIDIASEIPNVVAKTMTLLQNVDPIADNQHDHHTEQTCTLYQISTLHTQFEAWLVRFEALYDGPLFWNSTNGTFTGAAHHDAECRPKQTPVHSQLRFHSAPVAGVLVAYSSYRLKLWMLAANIRKRIGSYNRTEPTKGMERAVRREHVLAGKTAWLIMEAMPYLQSCFEESVVLQAPLKIAEEFYRSNDTP